MFLIRYFWREVGDAVDHDAPDLQRIMIMKSGRMKALISFPIELLRAGQHQQVIIK